MAVAVTTWTPATLDAFDTSEIIWQKLNQLAWSAGGMAPPPIAVGQQYLQADDLTWHLVDLVLEAGSNTERVDQSAAVSPGAQYRGYIVLVADDATKHKLNILLEGGSYILNAVQATTTEPGVASVSWVSSDAVSYPVTMVKEGGSYVLKVGQP